MRGWERANSRRRVGVCSLCFEAWVNLLWHPLREQPFIREPAQPFLKYILHKNKEDFTLEALLIHPGRLLWAYIFFCAIAWLWKVHVDGNEEGCISLVMIVMLTGFRRCSVYRWGGQDLFRTGVTCCTDRVCSRLFGYKKLQAVTVTTASSCPPAPGSQDLEFAN